MKTDEIRKYARKHKKKIMEWQKWLRKQSGKTIAEIDWNTEPKMKRRK